MQVSTAGAVAWLVVLMAHPCGASFCAGIMQKDLRERTPQAYLHHMSDPPAPPCTTKHGGMQTDCAREHCCSGRRAEESCA